MHCNIQRLMLINKHFFGSIYWQSKLSINLFQVHTRSINDLQCKLLFSHMRSTSQILRRFALTVISTLSTSTLSNFAFLTHRPKTVLPQNCRRDTSILQNTHFGVIFIYAHLQTEHIMVWWCPSRFPSVRQFDSSSAHFMHFSPTSFDILNWKFAYDFDSMYYRPSSSILILRQLL